MCIRTYIYVLQWQTFHAKEQIPGEHHLVASWIIRSSCANAPAVKIFLRQPFHLVLLISRKLQKLRCWCSPRLLKDTNANQFRVSQFHFRRSLFFWKSITLPKKRSIGSPYYKCRIGWSSTARKRFLLNAVLCAPSNAKLGEVDLFDHLAMLQVYSTAHLPKYQSQK